MLSQASQGISFRHNSFLENQDGHTLNGHIDWVYHCVREEDIHEQIDLLAEALEEPAGFAPQNFTNHVLDMLQSLGEMMEGDRLNFQALRDLTQNAKKMEEDVLYILENQFGINETEISR